MSKAKVEFGDNTAVGNYSQLLGPPIVSGAFFQLAVTRSSAGQLKTYVDGTLVTHGRRRPGRGHV